MSSATTRGVQVDVESEYLPDRSDPEGGNYFFVYHVKISNIGEIAVKLVSRHWFITNSEGRTEEVQGPGVIGQQPRLEPGESFEYTSFCPLSTPVGSMHGTYQMVTDQGERFDAKIAAFTLVFGEMTLH